MNLGGRNMKELRPIEDKIIEEGFVITELRYDCKEGEFTIMFKDPKQKKGETYSFTSNY